MNTNRTEFVSTRPNVNIIRTILFSLITLLAQTGCQIMPQTNLVRAASPATPAAARFESIHVAEIQPVIQPTSTLITAPKPAMEPTPVPTQAKREGPVYTGEHLQVDENAGFAVWLPSGWVVAENESGITGTMYLPNPLDPETFLSVEKSQLSAPIQAVDSQDLQQALLTELAAQPGFELESEETWANDTMVILDARFTFDHEGLHHKSWIRRASFGCVQYTITAQGIDAAEFEYWLPMFYNIIETIQLATPPLAECPSANTP